MLTIDITEEQLTKVNDLRGLKGQAPLDPTGLRRALDWTDEPRRVSVPRTGTARFAAVLGFDLKVNVETGAVYLLTDSETEAGVVAALIGGLAQVWGDYTTRGYVKQPFMDDFIDVIPGPDAYTGPAVELPRDVVELAGQASLAMAQAWGMR